MVTFTIGHVAFLTHFFTRLVYTWVIYPLVNS